MPYFDYLAQDAQNKQVKGVLEAKDAGEAKVKLRQLGLYIIWVRPQSYFSGRFFLGPKVKNADLVIFGHQFAALISGGITVIRALKAMSEESTNKAFRDVIDKIRSDVENGASLSTAFSKHPGVFSPFFTSIIKSGEAGGVLPMALKRLADYLEKEDILKRKVVSSFAYPVIVGIVAVGAVSFLLVFVVPVFSRVYSSLGTNLPFPTLLLIAISNIMIKFWWLVMLLAGASFYGLRLLRHNDKFRLNFDRFCLTAPVFGILNRKVASSRFVRTLSTLIGSGLTLNSSLPIVKDVVGNRAFVHAVDLMQGAINKGNQLSDSLKETGYFPPIVVQMVSAGEESGSLNSLLDKCADFLDKDIDTLINNLVVKLEPTLTFLLAVIIGFIALAIYLPMFDLMQQIAR